MKYTKTLTLVAAACLMLGAAPAKATTSISIETELAGQPDFNTGLDTFDIIQDGLTLTFTRVGGIGLGNDPFNDRNVGVAGNGAVTIDAGTDEALLLSFDADVHLEQLFFGTFFGGVNVSAPGIDVDSTDNTVNFDPSVHVAEGDFITLTALGASPSAGFASLGNITVSVVPEPTSLALLATPMALVAFRRRRVR